MTNRARRHDALPFQPCVGVHQFVDVAPGVTEVIEAGCRRRLFVRVIFCRAEVDESEAVVLVVIGQEGQSVVAVLYARLENPCVPVDHLLETVGVQGDVSELAWRGHGSLSWLARVGLRLANKGLSLPGETY